MRPTPLRRNNSLLHVLILLAIFFAAAGLRWWGIDFGLPYLYHPDEPNKVELAQQFLKTWDLNPHYFLKPPFYIYLNAFAYFPYLAFQRLRGSPLSIEDLQPPTTLIWGTGYSPHPETVLIGRALTLLIGSLTAVLVYLLVRKVFENSLAAGLAALFVAGSPGLSVHSRFITPDSLVVFFCLLTAWASVNIYQRGKPSDYLLAGAFGALAASAKYNAALVLLLPAFAHFLRSGLAGSFRDKKIWITIAAAPAAFLLLNPIVLFAFREFYEGAFFEASHYFTGHAGMEGDSLAWYLRYFWQTEGPIAVLGALGIIAALFQREKKLLVLAAFPIIFFVFISALMVRNDRTAIPITPFLYIFAANLLVTLFQRREPVRWKKLLVQGASGLAVVFLLSFAINASVRSAIQLTTPDSRETARVWIENNLPGGETIAIESYAPFVDPQRYTVTITRKIIDHDPSWYQENGVEYIIASQGMYQRYYDEPDLYASQVAQYEDLFRTFAPVRIFTDQGYEVRLYRVQ